MSRAISRESFKELKNYLGVYLQQGRVILDSDWNESQDITLSALRRLNREALGEGSPNRGFAIDPAIPPPPSLLLGTLDTSGLDLNEAIGAIAGACFADFLSLLLYLIFGPLLFFLNFPGQKLEDFESLQGFSLSSPQGKLRIGRDRPYAGRGFLRLSGHAGTVTVTKTLSNLTDLSAFELATFRYRLNQQTPGTMKFFLEDNNGNRSVWRVSNSAFGKEIWLSGFASPLDLNFRILTPELAAAVQGKSFSRELQTFSGTTPMIWALASGALPPGMTLAASGAGADSKKGKISGTPTASGTFNFRVRVTDANSLQATRDYTLVVKPSGDVPLALPHPSEILGNLTKFETPTGTPANLTRIRRYGFELYQEPASPLIWDLDDLRLGSSALEADMARNNFIIRGSEFSQFLSTITLLSILQSANLDDDGGGGGSGGGGGGGDDSNFLQNILDLLNTDFQLSEPSLDNAGRLYVAGYPCAIVDDTLYSQQADPNDPPLAPPGPGVQRKDMVYLDVWKEPVTFVEDPEIREIALGGPDTSTRLRVRYRVRVNEGGPQPAGNGIGLGTLATEGIYTGQANRLYQVEIDTPGDIGTATFRWSEDNASTLGRVIEPIPPGATRVVLEDAAAFHPGDFILIRKEFGAEEHQVSSVFGNVLTLQSPTGAQLAALPAAARVPNFTTFALEDRPMVQRWNAFRVPVAVDAGDATISQAINLNDGVQVRFGGRAMRQGDYWNFKTRFLAGDEASGLNPETRIEELSFQRARGVVHHYVPLAVLNRDGDALEPDQIIQIQDRRQRIGNASTAAKALKKITGLTGTATTFVDGVPLPPIAPDSKLLVFLAGDLFVSPGVLPSDSRLTIRVSFYNDEMTNPATAPDKGKIQDRELTIPINRKPQGQEVPLNLLFGKSDTPFLFLPITMVPTSVQVFFTLNKAGFTVEMVNMQLTVVELKKSF
jgi:hypothetical protein